MRLKFLLYTCTVLLIIGCSQKNDNTAKQTDKVSQITVDTLYAFTGFETHGIAQPIEIALFDNGSMAVVDFDQMKINLISKSGDLKTAFGREGRGPGEFIRIDDLFVTDNMIYVIDTNQSMISKFDSDGNFINGHTYKSASILNEAAVIDKTKYVMATGGSDHSLLSITDFNTDSAFNFGTPKGESLEAVDLQASLNQLKNGEIPDLYKNMTTIRANGDYIYAYLNAFSELQKYDLNGNLVWGQVLDLPYNEDIFNAAVEKAKTSPGGLPAYNYINDFEIFDEEIVILINVKSPESPQLLVKISDKGRISAIYTLPDSIGYLSAFDIAPESNTAYFTSPEDGVVYTGSISL